MTPAPKRRWWRIALWTSILVVVCAGAWQLLLRNVGARFVHGEMAEFEQMPASDSDLGIWLGKQPGVDPYSVHIFREGNHLTVHFMIDRDARGEPPYPDLMSKCRSLGYSGAAGPFQERLAPYSWGDGDWHLPRVLDSR
jgi:hypothetical protein